MSFNAIEAFNAKLSDAEMSNEYVCSDRQYQPIRDSMNANYNTGYINFNSVQMTGSDPKKVLDLNSSFLFIPYGAVAHLSGGTGTGADTTSFGSLDSSNNGVLQKSDALLLAPKGVHHLFSQMTVRFGGVTVHQPISHLNYYLNEQLKAMNADQYRMFADILGHAWDSAESYTLDSNILERNNNIVHNPSSWLIGLDSDRFPNEGHLNRIYKNNVDLASTNMRLGIASQMNALKTGAGTASSSVLQDIYSPALVGVYDATGNAITPDASGNYKSTSGAITTLMFQYTAIIPLSIISNFFKEMPSINTLSNFEIKLLTNLSPANSWSATYGATAADPMHPVSTASTQTAGESCPFMLSPLSSSGSSGARVNGDGMTVTVCPFVGYYNSPPTLATSGSAKKVAQNSLLPCQMWIPSVNLTDPYMDLLLSNKTKRILYNDYQSDATITGVAPYATAQRFLTYQVSRLRKLYILPYLSNASAKDSTKACDPRQSLVSSAPNTCSFAKISNLQVSLGSINVFSEPQSYDFLHYLNGSFVQQGLTNGNDFKSLSMVGQVRFSDWRRCYGAYVVDIERVSDEVTDDIIKNIQVSFKNDTPNTYDYVVIIEYQAEIEIDRVSGQVVATGSV